MTTLTAKLCVHRADDAIEFYRRALGARVVERYTVGDAVVFARIDIDGASLEIKDGDGIDPAIETVGTSPVLFTLDVDDARAIFDRMVSAGAVVRFDLDAQVYGMLQGRVVDPFGVNWIVSERTEDLSATEIQARTEGAFGN